MNEPELLFSQTLGCDLFTLRLNKDRRLARKESSFIASALKRRIKGEPLQYILGETEFMGLRFKLDKRVLIPRPETELIVEKAIRLVRSYGLEVRDLDVLDLGTGSGCIAVSLAKFLPEVKITATDISKEALDVARENAKLNNVSINFLQADFFSIYNLQPMTYNLIISNPPYIAEAEIDSLQPEIRYEPRIALNGGADGLDFYRRLAVEIPCHMKEKGLLVLEMGFGQSGAVKSIFKMSGKLIEKESIRDYNNIERVLVLERA